MGQHSSYYLYQKYAKYGSQDWLPVYPYAYSIDAEGTMPLVIKLENDTACGYVPPELYRWINLDPATDYYCEYCGIKASGTYGTSGDTFIVNCNTSTTLVSSDLPYTGITYVNVGECVTEIGNNAFKSNATLSGVSIPSTVTSIGTSAFTNCQGLIDCILPDSVTSIGSGAFKDCISLSNFVLWDSVTTLGRESTFENCDSLISINIPTGLTSIPDACFKSCGALSEITIPSGITSIGINAFYGCGGLLSITLKGTTPPTLETGAFDHTNECPIYVPCDCVDIYKNAWSNSYYTGRIMGELSCYKLIANYNNSTRYTVNCNQSSVLSRYEVTGSSTAYDYMTNAYIGDCVTSIGQYAFNSCFSLTSCTIGSNITEIGYGAFYWCTALPSIDIPNNVTSIRDVAFYSCSGLTSIHIPKNVASISTNAAFGRCYSITSMTVDSSNTTYDSRDNCNGIILTWNNYLVYGCKTTTIPNTVTTIGYEAFYGCINLTNIDIPSSVTSIGSSAFGYCSGLTSVTIHAVTPPSISESYTFAGTPITNGTGYIYVPSESVSAYKSAWSALANQILPITA